MDEADIDTRDNRVAYAKLIAEVWTKPETERLFRADPRSAAIKAGLKLPPGLEVKWVEHGEAFFVRNEGGKTTLELLLRQKPSDLSDSEIDQWSPSAVGAFYPGGSCSSSSHHGSRNEP
ncbi:hypothetical protein [Pyxidicoccus sp. MSG2]|uniref:hypothetical protein n=1 Tax=Pyxidicoccus sp. MSG2 TaxID=2996790 RepID=UPI002270D5C6|nr:hypothetical protein [Pyxidicoccus sp. MSG2]MCY1014465.1 hypothetical protein [Pyxidicoccus sp. MSG2]